MWRNVKLSKMWMGEEEKDEKNEKWYGKTAEKD